MKSCMTPRERKRLRAESVARSRAAMEEAKRIVAGGKCPQCGSKLKRNLSLNGWWQCEQFGNEAFRARPQEPACSFQCFTD